MERYVRVYRDIDLVIKLETPESDEERGKGGEVVVHRQPRVGECERERERKRDSKHPCDQFAQDDTEMREAVL